MAIFWSQTFPHETRFYQLSKGVPGKLLLKLPMQKIVMAQWASGSHVQDWTTQLTKLAEQKMVEPVVRIKATSN
jgi:hypothetical protein